jgi:hypothetical protein
VIPGRALNRMIASAFLSLSTPPSPAERGWDCRSAGPSLMRMEAGYGQRRMNLAEQCFNSPCPTPKTHVSLQPVRQNAFGRGDFRFGHSRLIGPALPVSRCPLPSESDRSAALQRNDAMGQNAASSKQPLAVSRGRSLGTPGRLHCRIRFSWVGHVEIR